MNKNGFTLIEFFVSLFIVLVGVLGTFSVIQTVSRYSSMDSAKLQAAYLAEEGLEVIRNIRDTNYVLGNSWTDNIQSVASYKLQARSTRFPDPLCGDYLFLDDRNSPYYYQCTTRPNSQELQRQLEVELSGSMMIVISKVTWKDRGKQQELFVQENFYDWYR
jgi:type II secretory pathway pseudopilin PulG